MNAESDWEGLQMDVRVELIRVTQARLPFAVCHTLPTVTRLVTAATAAHGPPLGVPTLSFRSYTCAIPFISELYSCL